MKTRYFLIAASLLALVPLSDAQARHHRPLQTAAHTFIQPQASLDTDRADPRYTSQPAAIEPMGRGHLRPERPVAAHGMDLAGLGIVRSRKTGATAHVSAQYAGTFQAYIDDLEANGATVKFMGGYRRGVCSARSEHPCGKALDVCQLSRGVVDSRCNLPSRSTLIEIANRHGLQEGGEWCSSDKGHAQIDRTAARCGGNLYAAVAEFHAKRHHHRYASR